MSKKRPVKKKKKKSLFSSLFEVAEENETFADPDDEQGDPVDLLTLFDDEDDDLWAETDEEDRTAFKNMKWKDGEAVSEDTDSPEESFRKVVRDQKERGKNSSGSKKSKKSKHAREQKPQTEEEPPKSRREKTVELPPVKPIVAEHAASEKPAATAEPTDRALTEAPSAAAEPTVRAPSEDASDEPPVFDRTSGGESSADAEKPEQKVKRLTAKDFIARSERPGKEASLRAVQPKADAAPETSDEEKTEEDPPTEKKVQRSEPTVTPSEDEQQPADQKTETKAGGKAGSAVGDGAVRSERPTSSSGHKHTKKKKISGGIRVEMQETAGSRAREQARSRQRAKAEELQKKQEREKQKRRKKIRKLIGEIASNFVFLGALGVMLIAALYYVFLLNEVPVTGNETYSDEYIVSLSGLELNKHMLLQKIDDVKYNVETNPYIQVESVDYIFPSRIRIRVSERKEIAAIIGLDYNVIIDHNGYVLSMDASSDISNLIRVTGVSMRGFQVGQRLGTENDFSTATMIQLIRSLEDYMLTDSISSVDLTSPLAITMTASNGLKIFVGQSTELQDKMLSLRTILPQFFKANISSGTVYLSAKGGTVYSPPDTGAVIPEQTELPEDPGILPVTPETVQPEQPEQPETAPETTTPIQPGGGDAFQG